MPEDRGQILARFPTNNRKEIGADDVRALVDASFGGEDSLAVRINAISSGFQIAGVVANVAALPTGQTDGTAYITENDGSTHVYHSAHGWTQMHSTIEPRLATVEHDLIALRIKVNVGNVGATLGQLPLTFAKLREMSYETAYPLPSDLIPPVPGVPAILTEPVNTLMTVGLTVHELGFQVKGAYIIRWAPDMWVLVGRKWTGSPAENPFWMMLVADSAVSDSALVGIIAGFKADSAQLDEEIGNVMALGSETLVHHIVALEKRIQSLEHHSTAHATVNPAEFILIASLDSVLHTMLFLTAKTDSSGLTTDPHDTLFNGLPHIIQIQWDGVKPDLSHVNSVYIEGQADDNMGVIRFLGERVVTAAMVETWVEHQTHVTVLWDAANDDFNFIKAAQVAITT